MYEQTNKNIQQELEEHADVSVRTDTANRKGRRTRRRRRRRRKKKKESQQKGRQ